MLVENNFIKVVGKNVKKPDGAYVVGGKGRTITPGLIDMYQHIIFNAPEGTNSFTQISCAKTFPHKGTVPSVVKSPLRAAGYLATSFVLGMLN